MDFYLYTIQFDTTLDKIVSDEFSVFKSFKNRQSELLEYTVEDQSNYDRILKQYSSQDLVDKASEIISRQLSLVKSGTTMILPKGDLVVDLVALTGRNLFVKEESNFSAFYGSYLDLLRRDDYTPVFKSSNPDYDIDVREYQISIWVWSRSYSQNGNTLLDLSKFVESANITVNGVQNSFNVTFQAIQGEENLIDINQEFLSRFDISLEDKIPISWLFKILQQNDIFFIRFERLLLEKVEDRESKFLEISSSELPGKVFDMIGLVDRVSSSFQSEVTDLNIQVTGRDFTKLLIEDGSYFFPLLFIENSDTLFFNSQDNSRWFKRNFVKGTYENLFMYRMQSIKDSLGFVINQLSNLGVCNDELFSSYDKGSGGAGTRRTQVIKLTGEDSNVITWDVIAGVWQIIDMLVDPQIDDRRIANSQIANPNSNLIGVIDSFCQKPFVEFFGDTYGDKYVFIARQPPFTKNAILSVLNSGDYIDVSVREIINLDLEWETTFYTWYQMDPRNMFLGKSDSIALAYLPIVYFPEIADTLGNKQLSVTDNYISNKAFTGVEGSIARDEFKQKVVEDFIYVIESNSYLPFTQAGLIRIKRDRRIKARTWIKIQNMFFYIDSLTNSFMSRDEEIGGETVLNVSRGMVIDYIRGKIVEEFGREIDYWSMIRLDVIRKTLIQKLTIVDGDSEVIAEVKVAKNTVKTSFGTDREVFDYFLQRKFFI